ncbi:murein DD-endopeptidase MepM/ murein hydrolase activator NlpD [Evansella vedderi]|uniref:Murein DD-endopeptidase MepM/ murein hydrolase activator NlpD n=1 Tax=Evansella vedderi TaxID=38282 RepID=A0ABU0A4I6_9BACI|nr:M23 family metallopeptidase [Evansella vedderi]MDQ0257588.1 murein DD-endopeptidase MepM/ murein hydrolase activator NlpD [Evansella vedderi]
MSLFKSTILFHRSGDEKLARRNLYLIVALLLIAAIIFSTNSALANSDEEEGDYRISISTVYHVYYGSDRLGVVDDKDLVKDYETKLIKELSEKYDDLDFKLSKSITVIPEIVFNTRVNNDSTLSLLGEKVDVLASTYKVLIDDQEIGHVSRDEDYDEFVKAFVLEYVSESELEAFEEGIPMEEELSKLDIGDSIITNIELSEEIEWVQSSADADEVLSVSDILKIMHQGTLEQEVYTVDAGDVLGTIANSHGLTLSEIKDINPGITEDSLLQIGDELNVTVLKPMVSLRVEKVSKREETISYETETKDDSDMWRGETRVSQEGIDGKKVVEYAVTYENGRPISTEVINEEITREATNKIVLRGTKTSPSRGSGQLAWPAVGGHISSQFGMRWGRQHNGIDIARPSNYNILAADNGTISSAGWENGYGNTIRINHNNGIETLYAHLASIDVSAGQTVAKGQTIGRMGSTGNSTGVHLHFEVHENGQVRNPMNYLRR